MEEIYRSYYTKSDAIVRYMVERLRLEPGLRILEPCAGDGAFVEALNGQLANLLIDVYEINPAAIRTLKEKFGDRPNVRVVEEDTLTCPDLAFFTTMGGRYDRIVANPPYGGWQDYDKRKDLKQLYPGLYVRETYSLFLYRCIGLLRSEGLLSFIVPDTFLNLHLHKTLREHLLTKTKILELALFPSSFFPGVNFGYSNLSIITAARATTQEEALNNVVHVVSGFESVDQLGKAKPRVHEIRQQDWLASMDHALFLTDDPGVAKLINSSPLRIGDIAACVTGFYSGNDKEFLRCSTSISRGNYQQINPDAVCSDWAHLPNLLDGIAGGRHFIPIVKGGAVKYYKPDKWYMDWSRSAVKHYKTDRKARFQNPTYYFSFGIGVPMVSSSQISAALIESRLFDQSIVGVFPYERELTYFLLAFFNSPTCNKLIRTINPSANNPANYIKKIPLIKPSRALRKRIDSLVQRILHSAREEGGYDDEWEAGLNASIQELYGF